MSGAQTLNIDNGPVPPTQQIDKTGQDALSPTTMVLNYLKERGFQPSSENVRRALEANARDPGVISGLRSDTADRDPVGTAVGGGALPTPPIPPTLEHTNQPTPAAAPAPPAPAPVADAGGGSLSTLGGLAAIVPQIAKMILSNTQMPPPVAPASAVTPPAAAGGSKMAQGFAQPIDEALAKATEGAPVIEGVNKVDPKLMTPRSKGPTTSVEGAKAPEIAFNDPASRVAGPPTAPQQQGPPAPPQEKATSAKTDEPVRGRAKGVRGRLRIH